MQIPGKLRIAWTSQAPNGARVDRGCIEALISTVKLFNELGHHVEECDPELDGAVVVPTFLTPLRPTWLSISRPTR